MKLYVVGIGPGEAAQLTPKAAAALTHCQVVAGYSLYLSQIEPLLEGKERIATGMTGEVERCSLAIQAALSGKTVAVVSGGDPGVYGMAGLVLELAASHPTLTVEVIPGVTAATAAAAVLGAPLGHDFVVVSLSDRLTSRGSIEQRLRLAAQGDFIICIYNPASHTRPDTLQWACDILLKELVDTTPCGIVRQVGREGESSTILTLRQLRDTAVDMSTTVIIGSRSTKVLGNRLVTPRGYRDI